MHLQTYDPNYIEHPGQQIIGKCFQSHIWSVFRKKKKKMQEQTYRTLIQPWTYNCGDVLGEIKGVIRFDRWGGGLAARRFKNITILCKSLVTIRVQVLCECVTQTKLTTHLPTKYAHIVYSVHKSMQTKGTVQTQASPSVGCYTWNTFNKGETARSGQVEHCRG